MYKVWIKKKNLTVRLKTVKCVNGLYLHYNNGFAQNRFPKETIVSLKFNSSLSRPKTEENEGRASVPFDLAGFLFINII